MELTPTSFMTNMNKSSRQSNTVWSCMELKVLYRERLQVTIGHKNHGAEQKSIEIKVLPRRSFTRKNHDHGQSTPAREVHAHGSSLASSDAYIA